MPMKFLDYFISQKKKSASLAKERLQIIVARERSHRLSKRFSRTRAHSEVNRPRPEGRQNAARRGSARRFAFGAACGAFPHRHGARSKQAECSSCESVIRAGRYHGARICRQLV